jgi:phosphatidylserine decarboxylase
LSALVDAYLRALSSPAASRSFGRLADARLPGPLLRALIHAWVRFYGVDLAEAAAPVASFRTFNEFFTRALRPGARPVDAAEGIIVSPCDARVYSLGPVAEDGRLEQVKGRTYSVGELLGSDDDARPFLRGAQATLYLSPAMYHRVHWPADGRIRGLRYIPGRLFPVNALAARNVDRLFAVNERVAIHLDSAAFGKLAVVMVGATNVGRITLTFDPLATNTGRPAEWVTPSSAGDVKRGDELGAFNLGSTVVLLAADARLASAGPAVGDLVKMGQALFRKT